MLLCRSLVCVLYFLSYLFIFQCFSLRPRLIICFYMVHIALASFCGVFFYIYFLSYLFIFQCFSLRPRLIICFYTVHIEQLGDDS